MFVGISALSDVEKTVARCRQLGVEHVLVHCASFPGFLENGHPDSAALSAFTSSLRTEGIEVSAAAYWLGRWSSRPWLEGSSNPDVLLINDRRWRHTIQATIEALGDAGITSMLTYLDTGKPLDEDEFEDCWKGLLNVYRDIVPTAESCGVHIATHSMHRLLSEDVREKAVSEGVALADYDTYEADGWGGPFLVGTWVGLRRLVEEVPSPNNGVTLCTGLDIPGGDVISLTQEFAGKIHFCQLRDHTDRWPGGREVLPGDGRLDLPAIIRALREAGYRGMVQPEHLGKPSEADEDLLAEAVSRTRALLAA